MEKVRDGGPPPQRASLRPKAIRNFITRVPVVYEEIGDGRIHSRVHYMADYVAVQQPVRQHHDPVQFSQLSVECIY